MTPEQAADLVWDLARPVIAELHRRGKPWNSYALVARILTEDTGYQGIGMSGYRYVTGELPAMDTISGRNLFDLLLALRADTPAPTGEAWKVAIEMRAEDTRL